MPSIHLCLARQAGAGTLAAELLPHDRSCVSGPALCTMKLSLKLIFYITILQIASAKINGGPRGRFSKFVQSKPSQHVSAHHTHYSYHPPAKLYYMCRHCSNFAAYPVYHKVPPTYVYKYRESGGRFSTLLAGLALYNLGRASAEHWDYTHLYTVHSDEKCSMQVISMHGKHTEEIGFPCFMMSSFMNRSPESYFPDPNALDISSPQIDVRPYLQYNGSMLKVTRDHECVLWHNTSTANDRFIIPCTLLKDYAETMKPSGVPVYVWVPATFAIMSAIYVCCHCYCQKKAKSDDPPFNSGNVIGYSTNVY